MLKQRSLLILLIIIVAYQINGTPPVFEGNDTAHNSSQGNKIEFTIKMFKDIANQPELYFAYLPCDVRNEICKYIATNLQKNVSSYSLTIGSGSRWPGDLP